MTHPQAFHTSCRSGLSGHPGFQFNAASPSLQRESLSQLAGRHAGYHVPRDMPLEPGVAELARFPVALKVAPVDGIGAVASRTTYVGREFRGRHGAPDEGRFGNYFSHIVIGNDDADAFDGLLGIELWDAPHWTDGESPVSELPEIGRLEAGPLDVARAAEVLADVPAAIIASVLDAAAAALDGGPRVVVVDPDGDRAAAWIAWVSYALPPAQARQLTFTTFDGRPRYADDVHLCLTTPACDTAFAPHELGRSVQLVDVAGGAPHERRSLYARVALALAQQGGDALATAVRAVPPDTAGERRGAWLAVAGELAELAERDELPAILELLRELAAGGDIAVAASTAKALLADTGVDRAMLVQWAALHLAARRLPGDEHSRSLSATALSRIVPFAGELPDDIPAVPHDALTQPAVGNLAPWLSAVERAAGTAACGPLVLDGLRLGLVGVNAAVDRRLAGVLSDSIGQPSAHDAIQALVGRPAFDHIIAAVTEAVADRAGTDRQARAHLRRLGRLAVARRTLQRRATDEPTFERLAAWLSAEVDADASRRRGAAASLAELAATSQEEAEIRELWAVCGPTDAHGHVELLAAYLDSGREPPLADGERALEQLMTRPLMQASITDPLGATLQRCGAHLHEHPAYLAWWVAVTEPGTLHRFSEWARAASEAMDADQRHLPDDRWRELCSIVCDQVIRHRRTHDYAQGIATLRAETAQLLEEGLVDVLTETLRDGEDNAYLLGALFSSWQQIRGPDGAALVDVVLPAAAQAVKRRDIERVEDCLPDWLLPEWTAWRERHPPRATVVARAFGRRQRQKPEAQQ